jgi:divalent metal cation (Fe/Co/Zn/Cd) transporter
MDRSNFLSQALWTEKVTILWNFIEAGIAIFSGIQARSIALIGFGLDSVIEWVAGVTLYRRINKELTQEVSSEKDDEKALKVVGVTFFLLAVYVLYEAIRTLVQKEQPQESWLGLSLSILSLGVMPFLGWKKLKLGKELNSRALIADSKETFACAWLSFALLLGLGLNGLLGWWWADPVAALLMVPFLIREGWEAFE